MLHKVGNAVSDDAGLATARPCQDEHRPLRGGNGFLLRGVEPGQ